MPSRQRKLLMAIADVLDAAERWVDARKPSLVTPEDVELLGATTRYQTILGKKPSTPPPAFDASEVATRPAVKTPR